MTARLLRIFSSPSLVVIYGRPGSFKTALSLWAASHISGKKTYVALGKHTFNRAPQGIVKKCVWDFRGLTRILLETYVRPPDVLIIDGLESLIAPFLGYVQERSVSQVFLFTAYTLLAASKRGCRCIMTLEGGAKPVFSRLLEGLDVHLLNVVTNGEELRVIVRGRKLEAVGSFSVEREMLLRFLEAGGQDAAEACKG